MPDSTGALINQLMNPPDPFARLGSMAQGMSAARQFQADQAAADAYRQSIDENGNFDQAKFNAIASQAPGGSFNFGRQMESAGSGLQAQSAGASADIQTKLDQQSAISTYLQPLTNTVINGGTVSGKQVTDLLSSMPPGLIPPTRLKEIQGQLDKIGPDGDATNVVRAAGFANQRAMEMMKMHLPNYGTISQGTYQIPFQANPLGSGGSTFPTRPIPMGPTPSEALGQNNIMNGIIQGGWTDPNTHQHKEGTVAQYYQDHNIVPPPGIGTLRAGPDGTVSFPDPTGGGAPLRITPAVPQAPAPGAPMPGARPAPGRVPAGRPPEPSGYITPPPPAQRGGAVMPPPRTIAAAEETFNADMADLPVSQDRTFRMRQALVGLEGARTGRGTEGLQTLNSVMGTWSPEWLNKGLGIKPLEMAANYDEAAKYLQQIANAQNVGGGNTNDKLAAAITATPNTHMSDLAAKELVHTMVAGEEMTQYVRQKAIEQNVAPADWAKYKAKWALDNDPRAFILQHITDPKKLQKLSDEINSGSPSGKKLKATIDAAVKDGVIPDPTQPKPVGP